MTRTTLKALWFGGGGILATWLAVSPNGGAPPTPPATEVRRPADSAKLEDLSAQAKRLRDRAAATKLRESTRNPFRFHSPKPIPHSPPVRTVQASPEPASPATPTPPALTLSGIAQKAGKRTAIITGAGQLYLAGDGDAVAGRYVVVKVDPEAVLLRDDAGTEHRLALPR
jgi:hypothetical protein